MHHTSDRGSCNPYQSAEPVGRSQCGVFVAIAMYAVLEMGV